jgi:hypothetical protein
VKALRACSSQSKLECKLYSSKKEKGMSSRKRLGTYLLGAGLALSLAAFAPAALAQDAANSSGTASAGNGGNMNPGTSSAGDAPRDTGVNTGATSPAGPIVNGVPANNPGTNTAPTTAGGSTGMGAYGTNGRGSANGAVPGHEVGYGTSGEAQHTGPATNSGANGNQ